MCRLGCGACCIAPSIKSPIPGMPHGKSAGERCVQLDDHNGCRLFQSPERPAVCGQFQAEAFICGENREQAMTQIAILEQVTAITV